MKTHANICSRRRAAWAHLFRLRRELDETRREIIHLDSVRRAHERRALGPVISLWGNDYDS